MASSFVEISSTGAFVPIKDIIPIARLIRAIMKLIRAIHEALRKAKSGCMSVFAINKPGWKKGRAIGMLEKLPLTRSSFGCVRI